MLVLGPVAAASRQPPRAADGLEHADVQLPCLVRSGARVRERRPAPRDQLAAFALVVRGQDQTPSHSSRSTGTLVTTWPSWRTIAQILRHSTLDASARACATTPALPWETAVTTGSGAAIRLRHWSASRASRLLQSPLSHTSTSVTFSPVLDTPHRTFPTTSRSQRHETSLTVTEDPGPRPPRRNTLAGPPSPRPRLTQRHSMERDGTAQASQPSLALLEDPISRLLYGSRGDDQETCAHCYCPVSSILPAQRSLHAREHPPPSRALQAHLTVECHLK